MVSIVELLNKGHSGTSHSVLILSEIKSELLPWCQKCVLFWEDCPFLRQSFNEGSTVNIFASKLLPFSVPGPPTSVKATILDKTSVILSWSPPLISNGLLLGFQVIYYGYKEQETSKVLNSCAMHTYLLYLSIIFRCMIRLLLDRQLK